jgi:hypothetical protein
MFFLKFGVTFCLLHFLRSVTIKYFSFLITNFSAFHFFFHYTWLLFFLWSVPFSVCTAQVPFLQSFSVNVFPYFSYTFLGFSFFHWTSLLFSLVNVLFFVLVVEAFFDLVCPLAATLVCHSRKPHRKNTLFCQFGTVVFSQLSLCLV